LRYPAPDQSGRRSGDSDAARPLALLVEDDPDAAEIGQQMLHLLGWETVVAVDGEEALFALSNCPPDLVVLDVCLPGMDGLGVLRIARRISSTRAVPVVVASAVYSPNSREGRMLQSLGASRLLAKPFGLKQLDAAIDDAVLEAESRREHRRELPLDGRALRACVHAEGGSVEVLVEECSGGALLLRSLAEPVPVCDLLELELVFGGSRIRAFGSLQDVDRSGPGWTMCFQPRVALPAERWDALLDTL